MVNKGTCIRPVCCYRCCESILLVVAAAPLTGKPGLIIFPALLLKSSNGDIDCKKLLFCNITVNANTQSITLAFHRREVIFEKAFQYSHLDSACSPLGEESCSSKFAARVHRFNIFHGLHSQAARLYSPLDRKIQLALYRARGSSTRTAPPQTYALLHNIHRASRIYSFRCSV